MKHDGCKTCIHASWKASGWPPPQTNRSTSCSLPLENVQASDDYAGGDDHQAPWPFHQYRFKKFATSSSSWPSRECMLWHHAVCCESTGAISTVDSTPAPAQRHRQWETPESAPASRIVLCMYTLQRGTPSCMPPTLQSSPAPWHPCTCI